MKELDQVFIMPLWNWIMLVALVVTGIILHLGLLFLSKFFRNLMLRSRIGESRRWLEQTWKALEKPLTWIAIHILWFIALYGFHFHKESLSFLAHSLKTSLGLCFVWAIYKLSFPFEANYVEKARSISPTMSLQVVPILARSFRVLVVVGGFLILLQGLGINVMSLVAGLGIGGLVIALAAQDSAANLFGSIMILLDRPFRVGDWIRIPSVEGTVEEIGFRSTRVRTFSNSLVSIPNSVLVKEKIDNVGVRRFSRVRIVLDLHNENGPEQILEFVTQVKNHILLEPNVNKENVLVALDDINDSKVKILVQCHLAVNQGVSETEKKQELLIWILHEVKRLGLRFAPP